MSRSNPHWLSIIRCIVFLWAIFQLCRVVLTCLTTVQTQVTFIAWVNNPTLVNLASQWRTNKRSRWETAYIFEAQTKLTYLINWCNFGKFCTGICLLWEYLMEPWKGSLIGQKLILNLERSIAQWHNSSCSIK